LRKSPVLKQAGADRLFCGLRFGLVGAYIALIAMGAVDQLLAQGCARSALYSAVRFFKIKSRKVTEQLYATNSSDGVPAAPFIDAPPLAPIKIRVAGRYGRGLRLYQEAAADRMRL
jgi:hypothetical protein